MMAPKRILILLALFSCALLTQSSIKIGADTKTNTGLFQRNRTEKDDSNYSIAKKQEVFVPSSRELYGDYGRRYDYPVSQLPLFRAHLEREPIPSIRRQFPFSSSIVGRNDEEPREEYIPRRRFGYDGGLESTRNENSNRFFDAQDFGNTFERTGNFMFQDQERQRPDLEDIPSRLPFEPEVKYQEESRPIEEPADTRVSPVSPKPYPQDMSYSELLRARPVVDVEDYPQRLSYQDDTGLWQQQAVDLRAKAEALTAQKHLKHLIEEVGPTVTLKQVLNKYGPRVASLFSELQRATGARFPNPINETKFTPKAHKTKQSKPQNLPSHHDGSKNVQNNTGRTAANLTKSDRKTLELASEVTKEAKDFIKIFKWFNKYYKSFKNNTTKVDSDVRKGDNVSDMKKKKVRIMKITKNIPEGNNEDDMRRKKVRIEKHRKSEHQGKERTWVYEKIENILNSL